jgi:hypothetical protein
MTDFTQEYESIYRANLAVANDWTSTAQRSIARRKREDDEDGSRYVPLLPFVFAE